MGKKLLILEAPSKAKKVQTFLSSDYIVKASVGHIRELPMPKNMTPAQRERYGDYAIDVNSGNFEPLFKNAPDKAKVIKELKDALAKCECVILMTDDDNEGHSISHHLIEVLQPTVPIYRAVTNEITKAGVDQALKTMKLVDTKKKTPKDFYGPAESALTRALWDRLYGFSTSPYVWRAIRSGTSSGRVQTPGARLVVEREERRLAFKSVNYYSIGGVFDGVPSKLVEFNGEKIATGKNIDDDGNLAAGYLLITDDNLQDILEALRSKDYSISDIKSKPYRRSAPPPFNTSSALQSIGGKTGMSSKQLTGILQGLYMAGDVTYIRTLSVEAAPEAIKAARKSLRSIYGSSYVSTPPNVHRDKKQGNSGHECIRPTLDSKNELLKKSFSDPKVQKVFDLIRKRMLASQAIDCTGTTWTMLVTASDKKAVFSASETEIHEPGWTKIYSADDEDLKAAAQEFCRRGHATIKDLKKGTKVSLEDLSSDSHQTQPPPRFSEVKLISELEKRGIGRPATFNSIVTTIQERGYVIKVGNQLVPTFLGFSVVKLLTKKFPTFTDYGYTAQMEKKLDEIAEHKLSREAFLTNFWSGPNGFAATVEKLINSIDYDEIKELSAIDLHNGYRIVSNRFGSFIEDPNGTTNEKGYLPSAKIDDLDSIDKYLDPEVCRELLERAANPIQSSELGELSSGEYRGWIVTVKDGKFGPFAQAVDPKNPKASPVNHKLPEGVTLENATLEALAPLFEEVKLPRWSSDKKWLVGIGKKGAYMGRKATAKSRPVFKALDPEYDPRTVSFSEVERLWNEKEDAAPAKKVTPKKPVAKKAPAKKVASKKPAAKKRAPKK